MPETKAVQIPYSGSFVPALMMGAQERWYAVQTRSRSEKKVHGQLQEKGIATFLPVLNEVHRWSDRKQSVEVPLFPGYVFVRMVHCGTTRLAVLSTSGVAGLVGTPSAAVAIPDKEIDDIQNVMHNEVPFAAFPFLKVGQRVRIKGGSLDGIEGILHSTNNDCSVVVSVHLIQRSLHIRVSGFDLQIL